MRRDLGILEVYSLALNLSRYKLSGIYVARLRCYLRLLLVLPFD